MHTFAHDLQHWFDHAMRPLPWRQDYSPYHVWLSEIMLQQTQMERGVAYYTNWLRRFPDISSVAAAPLDDILSAWEGLGYYSRARNLHAAAKHIMAEHSGVFPDSLEAVRRLPGVGDYTAGAILSIAFNMPVPAVDANVLRIFSRILDIDKPVSDSGVRDRVTENVRRLIPEDSPRRFNQALMELGALICGKNPKCGECPVAGVCKAYAAGTAAERPARREKKEYRQITAVAGVLLAGDRILVRRRAAQGLWAGMWELPGDVVSPGDNPEAVLWRSMRKTACTEVAVGENFATVRHSYTTNRVTLHGYICTLQGDSAAGNANWVAVDKLAGMAFSAGQRKVLQEYFRRFRALLPLSPPRRPCPISSP